MVKFLFSSKAAKMRDNPSQHYLSAIKTKTLEESVKICSKLTIKTLERRQ